jgi:uncharacterized protein YbbK (DUF523 family)
MKVCTVSACLLGFPCRYDGRAVADFSKKLEEEGYLPVPLCPEQLSGLPTPRDSCEIVGGDGYDVLCGEAMVKTRDGRDLTSNFLQGAKMAYRLCKIVKAEIFFAKNLSPSCGAGIIYDGSFTGNKKMGWGVTSAYLIKKGITVKILL